MQLLYSKEEEIMYAIWDIGHPCAISEILKTHPDLKRNTIKKVLLILEEKQYLKVDSIVKTATRTGRAYAPVISKDAYEKQKKLMADVIESPSVENGILNYCSTLTDTKKCTKEFIYELEKIVQDFKKREDL